MKFFIPDISDPDLAEKTYDAIKNFAVMTVGWIPSDRRIFRIQYKDKGISREMEIGKINDINNEPVIAILEAKPCYLVCTPNRGILRDMPILVGEREASFVEDFE